MIGNSLIVLGSVLAALILESAKDYFTGNSCSMALLGFTFAPVVLLVWFAGVVAIIKSGR